MILKGPKGPFLFPSICFISVQLYKNQLVDYFKQQLNKS